MARDQVFISYSHADANWLQKLQTMLAPLQHQVNFKVWADTDIKPGQVWKEEIEKALSRAKVAVLLVSPDFLASRFIQDSELQPLFNAARQEGVVIISVPVRPSLFEETEIAQYQAVVDPDRPLSMLTRKEQEEVLFKIARIIYDALQDPTTIIGSHQVTKKYLERGKIGDYDYLCEAKLLIVGEPGAGKTSLAKKILNKDYQLQPDELSTRGIEIFRWNFPAGVRIKRDGKEDVILHDFLASIWDFGGQEIYYATHQFFLTRNSLYTLVVDDRKENTNFDYWLQSIELLSDSSPLLIVQNVIVQNEKHTRQRDINIYSLQACFANLKGTYQINLKTTRGLDDFIKVIKKELELLPHVGTAFPRTWQRVRKMLEEDAHNYISINDYFTICQTNGINNLEDQLTLSGTLHSLGICLHFQNDPVLKNIIILKPEWCTIAVYRVLDDHNIVHNHGRFSAKDLTRIWAEDQYASMQDELLRLMMKFQLCYEIPEDGTYIAVQLLPLSKPNYDWDESKNLILGYQYTFMPKGMIARFIVALHHLIAEKDLVWKSGVILKREDTRAEVIEDYLKNMIRVRIAGPDKRGLIAIVDDQLERIHRSFPSLKYDRYLSCNCEVCQKRSNPYAFPLSTLKDFASTGDLIQCHTSHKLIDPASLIRDIFPDVQLPIKKQLGESQLHDQEEVATSKKPYKEVFVSYAWTDISNAIVDQIEKAIKENDITLVRDRNEIKYKDSIRDFMKRIGRGKAIVLILSKRYLESENCMFELTEIADRGDIRNRVFPIVLEDAQIYKSIKRIQYIKYWEKQKDELNAEMKEVGGEYLEGIREDIDLYTKIRNTIARIVNILSDMNALTYQQHQGSHFDELLRMLEARLSE